MSTINPGKYIVEIKGKEKVHEWEVWEWSGGRWIEGDASCISRVIERFFSNEDIVSGFIAAMDYIDSSPSDPDVNNHQQECWSRLVKLDAWGMKKTLASVEPKAAEPNQ